MRSLRQQGQRATVCEMTWYCPADDVVEDGESGCECRGVTSYTQVDVERHGDGPQERTDTGKDCQRRV